MTDTTVHASAVLTGETGILIRGPSGAGKSRLAFALILAGRAASIPPTMLVGDDRIMLRRAGDRITASAAPTLEGLIEIRGLGIRRCDFVPHATLGLLVDLAAEDAARMPEQASMTDAILGIKVPRIPVGAGVDPLAIVTAALLTRPL